MLSSWQERAVFVFLTLGATLGAAGAVAETTVAPTQVLDRVNVVSPKAVLDMAFDDPAEASPFETPPEIQTGFGFSSCQLTATSGLFCLDFSPASNSSFLRPGRHVRRWDPVFADSQVGNPYVNCEDPRLGLDTSKGVETCMAVTADDMGGVVLAGKRKGSSYVLVKVALAADLYEDSANKSCRDGWQPMTNSAQCFKVLVPRDRPVLVDITYATVTFPDGAVCTGIIGLENRTALMFFRDPDATENLAPEGNCPITYAQTEVVGPRGWVPALGRGEVLQGATTIKFANGNGYAVVVSNTGVMRAKRLYDTSAPFLVKVDRANDGKDPYNNLELLRNARTSPSAASACLATSPQKFGLRTSTKSGRLYVTDYKYCEASALEFGAGAAATNADLAGVGLKIAEFGGGDLVLSTITNDTAGDAYPPLEPTLAPGISIDLSKCFGTEGCGLVAASDGSQIATLSNVKVVGNATGMTLFQVKNIPDCRWLPGSGSSYPSCSSAVVGGLTPQTQYLNITPLLPKEVTDQFPADSLPNMYISPQYRAQERNGYLFEAFFGVTEDGVIFQDMFELRLDVGQLAGKDWNCSQPTVTPGNLVQGLLELDISVTVSEKPIIVVGGRPDGNSDMLTNIGCGSTRTGAARWSAKPYNLEMNPAAYDHKHAVGTRSPPEDYFVHLTVDLFYDLYETQEYACETNRALGAASATSMPPIGDYCSSLTSKWFNAQSKLETCLRGTNYLKANAAVSNCNAFTSQLDGYIDILGSVPQCQVGQSCPDVENRLGELEARARSIRYVFTDRLIPSVPAEGFRYPAYEGRNPGTLPLLPAP